MKKIENVKLFLLDMDGTIYHSDTPIAGSFEKINELRNKGYKVKFLTNNSSKSPMAYVDKLQKLGLECEIEEIVTSGVITAHYIKREYPSKKVYLMGTQSLKDQFLREGINLVEDNPDICVLGYDSEINYEKLCKIVKYVRSNIPYIATHPDMVCPSNDGDLPDIGSYFQLIRSITQRMPDIICGKPYAETARFIEEKYNLKSNQIAMVGDRLYTDIKLGIDNDLFSILVLSGEADEEMLKESALKPDLILDSFKDLNI